MSRRPPATARSDGLTRHAPVAGETARHRRASPHRAPRAQARAYSSAARASNSNPTKASSPTTSASWPGSMT